MENEAMRQLHEIAERLPAQDLEEVIFYARIRAIAARRRMRRGPPGAATWAAMRPWQRNWLFIQAIYFAIPGSAAARLGSLARALVRGELDR